MKIWYDALTGKHVRYAAAVAKRLRDRGHELVLTTRKHPDTLPLASFLNEKFTAVGQYNPESLLTRLQDGINRQLCFCKMFQKEPPDVAISHGSADLCRVAFGLAKPAITTVDTPYADAVHRLTLPLSKHIVASNAIPARIMTDYNPKAEVTGFEGVDEYAWIKDFKPKTRYDFGKPLIVVRQIEEKAVYANNSEGLLSLAKKLTELGKVVFLSRYARTSIKNLIVPKGYVDSASLAAQADLFIGVGGTITREAALQGTPAIVIKVFNDQYVNEFLAEKGFPIFETEPEKTFKLAEKLLGKKQDVKRLLTKLEDPVDVIDKIVEKIGKR
jgi:predicted glycosyltransferase